MDNYSLEDVKTLINNNLVTPEVFNNILKSTTRRLELYNDKDDWEILKYLAKSSAVPVSSKEEIDIYLNLYENHTRICNDKSEEVVKKRQTTITIILSIIVVLTVICIILIMNKR